MAHEYVGFKCRFLPHAAADTLDVTHSTVSRRITAFEKQLGVRLFERLPGGYVPTPAGEAILTSALQLEEEIFRLERQVHGQDARLTGELRVTLTRPLVDLLMPDLVAFTKTFPGIEVGLIASVEMLNLTKQEADIAIRATERPPDHLIGRPCLPIPMRSMPRWPTSPSIM